MEESSLKAKNADGKGEIACYLSKLKAFVDNKINAAQWW